MAKNAFEIRIFKKDRLEFIKRRFIAHIQVQ
jgi:hypothetical protein